MKNDASQVEIAGSEEKVEEVVNPYYWPKRDRAAIVCVIYNLKFNESNDFDFEFDVEMLEEVIWGDKENELNAKLIKSSLKDYKKDREVITAEYVKYLDKPSKTFDVIHAILAGFVMERRWLESKEVESSRLVGKYIQLAQDVVGGGNTGLVHSVLGKLTDTDEEDNTKS